MTRSKSPFRSFRFKKPKAAGDDLDDDELRTIGKNSGNLDGDGPLVDSGLF